jgi:hypothetical protein
MLSGYDHGKMYCIWDVDTTAPEPRLTLEMYEAGAGLLEKRLFTWAEVTGAAKIERRKSAAVTPPAPAAAPKQ